MVIGAFRRLTEAVRGYDGRAKAQGYLKPIDTEEIARRLDLRTVAEARGAKDLPSSTAQALDAVEQSITQELEGEWAWHGGELVNNLRAYASRLIAVSIPTELANLQLKARDTLARFRDANHRAEAELGPLREDYLAFRDELADFRQKHRLRRTARAPSRRATTMGLLVVLVGVESVLNGLFFAKGAELGLVGGIGTAMGISAVNVALSFALGLFPMRWFNHRNWLIKLIGFVSSLAGLGALVALHGFAAHYRDATARVGEDRALSTALATLKSSPLALTDLNSFYLFGFGLVLALLAVWKGYTLDDPYPGYGAYSRRASHARDAYSDEHAFLFDDLTDIKEETISGLEAGIRRIPLFPQQAALIRSQRDAQIQSFRAYEAGVEASANRLLALYRDGNRAARPSPAPEYFDKPWRLSKSFLSNSETIAETSESAGNIPDADAALQELRALSREVLEEYETLLTNYPHPTQMKI